MQSGKEISELIKSNYISEVNKIKLILLDWSYCNSIDLLMYVYIKEFLE